MCILYTRIKNYDKISREKTRRKIKLIILQKMLEYSKKWRRSYFYVRPKNC